MRRLTGDNPRFNAQPVTTQKYHYRLYLSSPPPDGYSGSDSSVLSLSSSLEGHRALGVNLARDFNPDTGNVPDGLYEVVNVQ